MKRSLTILILTLFGCAASLAACDGDGASGGEKAPEAKREAGKGGGPGEAKRADCATFYRAVAETCAMGPAGETSGQCSRSFFLLSSLAGIPQLRERPEMMCSQGMEQLQKIPKGAPMTPHGQAMAPACATLKETFEARCLAPLNAGAPPEAIEACDAVVNGELGAMVENLCAQGLARFSAGDEGASK